MHRLLHDGADDLVSGGIAATVLAGHEQAPERSVPGLRLAGALHRLALTRRAPGYALLLPTTGGTYDADRLWPAAAAALAEHTDLVRHWLDATAVQTNEPGRCGPLWGGLQVASQHVGLPVRLLEVGSSGGLNLRPDRVGLRLEDGTVLGDAGSALQLAVRWAGRPAARLVEPLRVVARAGCDVDPVDVATSEGRAHLGSFVWADDLERWERLRAALELAAREPVTVTRASAPDFLAAELGRPAAGTLTVVWHSVVWQYVAAVDQQRLTAVLDRAAAAASDDAPFARLSFEPVRSGDVIAFELTLRSWPGDGAPVVLGRGDAHGTPFTWG